MISSDDLIQAALQLGFLRVGVAKAVEPPHYDAYRKWVALRQHGSMGYLDRHLEAKAHPNRLLPNCRSVVAVALDYAQPTEHTTGSPKIARYALGRDYHKVLRAKLRRLQALLASQHPEASWRICVDSAPIMERDFAQLAGIGWFGKNTCLIDSKFGSYFVLGLLLTDLAYSPSAPAVGGCGSCRACIDACPTGAIRWEEGRWSVVGERCLSYLTIEHAGEIGPELAPQVGDWTFGCDRCQEVCPFNNQRPSQPDRAKTTQEPDFLAKRQWPNLVQLANLEHAEWDTLTQGSPVRRAGLDGLRRNAQINLRNQ